MSADNYRSIPELAAYIDRIGAEQLNFKRFMVKEHKGHYYTERALIRLEWKNNKLEIIVSNDDYAPTDVELANIRSALTVDTFPKAALATVAQYEKLVASLGPDPITYAFYKRSGNGISGITMVQQRVDYPDKPKRYIPWTFFSDGEWRRMEPDGALPFWKPREKRSNLIMIHEGAKAAEIIDRMLNDDTPEAMELRGKHPWAQELAAYEHWGMIGGALAPQRTDYKELHAESPIEVVYVSDNDWAGKAALQEVSRCYGGSLKGIIFDDRWPEAWDMGDDFPRNDRLWSKHGRYIGPSIKALLRPATYATETMVNPNTGRPVQVIRRAFRTEWYHCVQPEVFIHKDWPSTVYNLNEFNSFVSPFSGVVETSTLLKKDAVQKGAVLKYHPGLAPGVHVDRNGTFINTHMPAEIKAEKGDVTPFLEYMEHLLPIESDRHEVMRWCATLIARPSIKMKYAILMISETQGVGKTTLGENILAPLMGMENVSFPSEKDIVDSAYNYWIAHKRLAVVNEIYQGGSSKAYDSLKNVVTDKNITVSRKYQANYEVDSWVHIFACSNSLRALKISGDDRRWLIPKVTEEKKPYEYWVALNDWLTQDGGLEKIKGWAEDFLKKHKPVMPGEEAPWTSLKKEVIQEGLSPGQLLVQEVLIDLKERSEATGQPVLILDSDLVDLIKAEVYEGRPTDRLEKPLTLRKIAKGLEYGVCNQRVAIKSWGGKPGAKLVTMPKHLADKTPQQLAEMGLSPVKISEFRTGM